MSHLLVVSTLVALATFATNTYAQQQAPSQHGPAQHDYRQLPSAGDAAATTEAPGSQVTLKWDATPEALRFDLRIARTTDFASLVHSISVIQNTYVTPALAPGQYYYQVEAYRYERSLGKQPIKSFIVGKPLTVTSAKQKLEAPQIVAPKHLELFPTFGRVRLAWESVSGARGYRFRLWEEDKVRENRRWKRDVPPRWITEIKQPWIEVHDAPYTSYMYLQTGTYRWDVAAIDKDGGYIGDPATGYFRVSRQWHLKPEIFLRFHYFFTPFMDYQSFSSLSGQGYKESNSHQLAYKADLDWFPLRHWGVSLAGGNSNLGGQVGLPTSVDYFNVNLDALFRYHLSIEPRGWAFIGSLGLGIQEFPNIRNVTTNASDLQIERPRVMGPRFGFRFNRRWNNPWELQFLGNYMIPVWWFHDPSGGSSDLKQSVNGDLTSRVLYNWTDHFATGLGLQGEYRKLRYSPSVVHGESSVELQGINVNVTLQLRY